MRICRVHNLPLKTGKAEIRRGLPPAPPGGYSEAAESLFPLSRSVEMGGCVVGLELKDEKRIRFCPACRDAERKWLEDHDADEFWRP